MMSNKQSSIQYWKNIKRESNELFKDLSGLIFITHNSARFHDITSLLNKVLKDQHCDILYFSFTTSFKYIKNSLRENPIKNKQLHVIDLVSGFLLESQEEIECVYRKPPSTITDFKQLLLKNIDRVKPDIIFVDSISQFIKYSKTSNEQLFELYQFFGSLKIVLMEKGCKTAIMMYDEKDGPVKSLPIIFTDLVLKMEIIPP